MPNPATTRVLVTGASGFVGRSLCSLLQLRGLTVRAAVRRSADATAAELSPGDVVETGDIGPSTSWEKAVAGVDVVIHLAARVHVMRDTAANPLEAFRSVNVEPTIQLARTAARCGIRRLVFVSSIKVNGEETDGRPYTETDSPSPRDAYGLSKLEAETGLQQVSRSTGLEIVIVRPPLVYGPHVKGNFLRMLNWVHRGYPLPLAGASNRRSLIGVGHLSEALLACALEPHAANQTFLVSDNEDLSTSELLRRASAALGRQARLINVPANVLRIAARLTGQKEALRRLFGSLVIDSSKIRNLLGWTPPTSVHDELKLTADWYLAEHLAPLPAQRRAFQ